MYRPDPIVNFTLRYQATATNTTLSSARVVTRGNILNVMFTNLTSSTSNTRMFAAVRVNRITLTTAGSASLEWLSEYGPTSATLITGGTATTPGVLTQRPPDKSLCAVWSTSGSNESTNLFSLTQIQYDYIDVHYSAVFVDRSAGVSVSTSNSGTTGAVYRSYLDGPNGSAVYQPLAVQFLN
jgi:hypothetical protein